MLLINYWNGLGKSFMEVYPRKSSMEENAHLHVHAIPGMQWQPSYRSMTVTTSLIHRNPKYNLLALFFHVSDYTFM